MSEAQRMRAMIQRKWQRQEDTQGERAATVRLPMNVYLRLSAYAADRRITASEALAEIIPAYLDGKMEKEEKEKEKEGVRFPRDLFAEKER